MPNIKSAIKRVKVSSVKQLQNRMARSALRTAMKRYDAIIAEGDKQKAAEGLKKIVSYIDRSAAKGIIHKNTAARRKSAAVLKYNKLARA